VETKSGSPLFFLAFIQPVGCPYQVSQEVPVSALIMTSLSSAAATLVPNAVVLSVPLALGTLQWGTTWIDDKVINSKGVLTEETVQEIMKIVKKSGVTLLDTAEGYGGGTSEKRCGRLMMSSNDEGKQVQDDKILIMTKFLPAPWRVFHSDFERAVRGSCRRLNVASIDVYLLHSPVHWCRPIEYWIEAGARCYKLGLIKSMGLSNWYDERFGF
jgi:aryl-alcohol dehydrogenase-like predicted oxidoreductase